MTRTEALDALEPTLSPAHLASLIEGSRISPEVAHARGYRTVTDARDLLSLGFSQTQARVPGLLIPVRDAEGKVVHHQYRPDSPRIVDGKPVKYDGPKGASPRLDVPPMAAGGLRDPEVELWVTEGAKKADAAVSAGLCCVALAGVWNFRRKGAEGASETIPELDEIPLHGRRVVVCYDSDAVRKESVRSARDRLAEELASRGARVLFAALPEPKGEKVGLDDFLAGGGTSDELRGLAREWTPDEPKAQNRAETFQAAEVVRLAREAGLETWRDEEGRPCATFPHGGRPTSARVPSDELEAFLFSAYRRCSGRACRSQALEEAARQLAMEARLEGTAYPTATRLHRTQDAAFLFLADAGRTVVRVDADGWRALGPGEPCPARFLGSRHALPLPMPASGGSLEDLRPLLSLEEGGFEMAVGWLLGCFLPAGAMPLLLAAGQQGSGKSQGCRLLRGLVDPNRAPVRNLPRDARSLAAAAGASLVLAFDNVSRISDEMSDHLCTVSTGSGFASRELFTDSGESLVCVRAPVIVNGIGDVATRPDLLDRSLPLRFAPISEAERRPESEILARYEALRPGLLGALLDRVSAAYRNFGRVKDEGGLPRLADLAAWVNASEPEAERGRFVATLRRVRSEQSAAVVEGDALCAALVEMVEERGTVVEPAGRILALLRPSRPSELGPEDWPRTARQMAARLERMAQPLGSVGVGVELLRPSHQGRAWKIFRLPSRDGVRDGVDAPDVGPSRSQGGVLSLGAAPRDGRVGRDGVLPLKTEEEREWRKVA